VSQGPLERYRAHLHSGRLRPDPEQATVTQALDGLHRALRHYRSERESWWRAVFGMNGRDAPKGLYIHGTVGRGKSLLMDLFFAGAPIEKKRRVHFNAFMMEVHSHIHEWRTLSPEERAQRPEYVREADEDPIAPVAKRVADSALLLCFDEFQVHDVADAMILGRLFERLLEFGVVMVITSNTPPDRLYEGGLNRPLFLPFIAMIKQRLGVLELGGARDYRAERMAGVKIYNTPLGTEAEAAMNDAWQRLTKGVKPKERSLEVFGRPFIVPRAAAGVARFSFAQLCEAALGSADYVVLARNFHTILLDGIPRLGEDKANEARRLTLLVDTLYDERAKLICSAAAPPEDLFAGDPRGGDWFKRTVSRVLEMQSEEYLRLKPASQDAKEQAAEIA
jgi:cell division protein ZapE